MRPLLALLAVTCTAHAAVDYTIEFSQRAMLVSARFAQAATATVSFELDGWAGFYDYYRDIADVSAADAGRALTIDATANGKWIVHNGGHPFQLTYRVKSSKDAMITRDAGSQFRATLLDDWALAWGHAFVLLPTDNTLLDLPATVTVKPGAYKDWTATLPAGGKLARLADLRDQLILAGAFRTYDRSNPKVRYFFANRASESVSDADLMDSVQRIVTAQTHYMGRSAADTVLVAVTDGMPSSSGGTHVRNSLVIYPDLSQPLTAKDKPTLRLAAHELFHLWTSGLIHHASDAEWSDGKYGWFHEGFTEYYSAATLFRESLLDSAGYANYLNKQITEYAQNSAALLATNADLGSKHWADRDHQNLPYVKGALLGLLMDAQLRPTHTLDEFVRLVLDTTSRTYDEETLQRAWTAIAGGAGAEFWNGYVVTAAPLPFAEIFRRAGIGFEERDTPVFELGFTYDTPRLGPKSTITAVTAGSNAEKAGLLPGDVLTGVSVWYEDLAKLASFNVLRRDSKLDIRYRPIKTLHLAQVLPDGLAILRK